jgi:hypothetical protein
MSVTARVLFFVAAGCGLASTAAAQPGIFAFPFPPANERGWNNTGMQVEFLCARATQCADKATIKQEGRGLIVEGTAVDANGATGTTTVTLNIDGTAPVVTIESGRASTTSAASVTIVARTVDALSGPAAAACNGVPTTIANGGIIRCEVPLSVGANDVVVDVTDNADNSGSAGFRIVRTAASSRLSVVPENIGLIVGQVTTVQVQDGSGLTARSVVWESSNPAIGEMSNDDRHVFTAKAPGMSWLTARTGTASGQLLITVYAGDRLPPGATRWQVGTRIILQTPDTQPLKGGDTVSLLSTRREPDGMTIVESINRTTGWLNYREHSPTSPKETAVGIREIPGSGSGLVVFDTVDGRSALIRTGPTPWRYQFPNRVRPEIIRTSNGDVIVMERPASGMMQLVGLDGATGHVGVRDPLPRGVHVAFNVGCVKGAHGVSYVPTEVGPLNPQLNDLHFAMVISEDREDFGVCGQVSGNYKRKVAMATAGLCAPYREDLAATIEVTAAEDVPVIALFEVAVDRLGARLLPWTARDPKTGATQFRVARFADDANKEFKVPAGGKIWLSGRDDDNAVTTDGFTVVGFNVVTGAISYAYKYEGGIQILGVTNGNVMINRQGKEIKLEVPRGPQH